IESGEGLKSEITGNAGSSVEKAVEKLSAMRTGSEVTCEAITKAAENISQVIERIEAPGLSELPSSKTCGQLRHRIEHIMEMLDSQAEIVATMESGMKEAAEVRQNVVEPDRTAATDTVVAETCAEQERPDDRKSGGGTPAAIKKILDNRILVIDIIRKEHAMSVGTLGELLRGSSEISREQLPGNPEDSLSKWIEHYIERDDFFYDPVKCKQLAGFRDNMFACAMRAVEAFGAGKKDDMANNYQNVRQFSEQIESLLKEMRDDLQKNI
ncbi:MAG TPA: hypothetical protein VMB78_11815, partial [Dissulfurispiraceae bacterium]|nr:hypothetical protein [Dissulfurispiraceae bacterium]